MIKLPLNPQFLVLNGESYIKIHQSTFIDIFKPILIVWKLNFHELECKNCRFRPKNGDFK